jgi:hypothetical protein
MALTLNILLGINWKRSTLILLSSFFRCNADLTSAVGGHNGSRLRSILADLQRPRIWAQIRGDGGLRDLSQWVQLCTSRDMEPKSNSIFNLCSSAIRVLNNLCYCQGNDGLPDWAWWWNADAGLTQLTDEKNADAGLALSRHAGISLKALTSYSKYKNFPIFLDIYSKLS